MTVPKLKLCLTGHDEVFFIDLQRVLYIQADDHYCHVYYGTGTHFMVPYGLSRIETLLADMPEDTTFMQRMGRKYLVNCDRIFRVSTVKELLYLVDDQGGNVTLHIPKTVLRTWIDEL